MWSAIQRIRTAVMLSGIALILVLGVRASAAAQAVPPARFFGTVTIDGFPAPLGTVVQAFVGPYFCGSGIATLSASGGNSGATTTYAVDVASAAAQPGCGYDGALVTFRVGGLPALESGVFQTGGFITLSLSRVSVPPPALQAPIATVQSLSLSPFVTVNILAFPGSFAPFITISSLSDQGALLTLYPGADGASALLYIGAPAGFFAAITQATGASCVVVAGQPNVLACAVTPGAQLAFTTSPSAWS